MTDGACHRVFVYGTLKEGFPNFHVNGGARLPGLYVTLLPYPLYLVSDRQTPWMLDQPGSGLRVRGQLYEVDEATLAQMDVLEGTTLPDGYVRRRIAVAPADAPEAAVLEAEVYLKDPHQLQDALVRHGPLSEYTEEHAARYRPRSAVLG